MANSRIPENPDSLVGRRIELTHMDDLDPIAVGSVGEVQKVTRWSDGTYQLSVKWEGQTRRLSMVCPPDEFIILD